MNHTPQSLAEMRQLDARLEARLDQIAKAEANLRGLCDALRVQVQAAYPVLQQLQQITPAATEAAAKAPSPPAIDLSALVADAKASLEASLAESRRQALADLHEATDAATADVRRAAEFNPDSIAVPQVEQLTAWFVGEVRETMKLQRELLLDQLATLGAEATMRVEPLLSDLTQKRVLADEHVRSVVAAAEKTMQSRADQLGRGVEAITAAMEERLSQRLASLRRRGEQSLDTLQDNALAAVAAAEQVLASGEQRLADRTAAMQQRVASMVSDAAGELGQQIAHVETHAEAMTGICVNA